MPKVIGLAVLLGLLGCTPPTAPPLPSPTPTPVVLGCGLPRGEGNGEGCTSLEPRLGEAINNAIDKVILTHPEWFRGDEILFPSLFTAEVVEQLQKDGYCAFYDGEEVALKNSNEFSEQWDIIRTPSTGGYFVMRHYVCTFSPALGSIP